MLSSEQKFESRGDSALLQSIESALKSGGVEYEKEKRGLDHGVWGKSPLEIQHTFRFRSQYKYDRMLIVSQSRSK